MNGQNNIPIMKPKCSVDLINEINEFDLDNLSS
jgi:hypothetical protein